MKSQIRDDGFPTGSDAMTAAFVRRVWLLSEN